MGKHTEVHNATGQKHKRNVNLAVETLDAHFKAKTTSSHTTTSAPVSDSGTINNIDTVSMSYSIMPSSSLKLLSVDCNKNNQNQPKEMNFCVPNSPPVLIVQNKTDNKLTNFTREDGLKAEILWALKVLTSHYSLNSCERTDKLFQKMFPDSVIAQKLYCCKTKCNCTITFGLAPYFEEKLYKQLQETDFFVISLDESFNSIISEEQMDFQIRYWDNEKKKIVT